VVNWESANDFAPAESQNTPRYQCLANGEYREAQQLSASRPSCVRSVLPSLRICQFFPFSDRQEQTTRALFHNPVYPILHQALKHPTNWDAAPHPQYEPHWSAFVLDLLADCCKRMLICSLSKQGFVGDCISLTPVWRAPELLIGKTPDEHSL
jgi:hypothetical protein